MGNLIKSVDEFFSVLIPDEMGRFFFLHLPFWGLLIWIAWFFALESGLWLIWIALVLVVPPALIALFSLQVYKAGQEEQVSFANGWVTMFRAWCAVYVVLTLALIGIPGWYSGGFMEVVQSMLFAKAYRWVLIAWWKLFHFYQSDYKVKDIREFLVSYIFEYKTWQWCFLFSAVVTAPGLFIWLYLDDKKKAKAFALEEARKDKEAKAKLEKEEAEQVRVEERRVANEKRRLAEIEAEREEKRKLQAKINEVKGKDPWDSGFL